MEFGPVRKMLSRFHNDNIVVYNSVRKPGFVYKFFLHKENSYRCCRCFELRKQRYITVLNGVVVGRKNPEDDHHPDCESIAEAVVRAQEADREMRHQVSSLSRAIVRDVYNTLVKKERSVILSTTACLSVCRL